ncbi:MAG: DUF4397 domain-containing protein [Myxococcota bacterium]
MKKLLLVTGWLLVGCDETPDENEDTGQPGIVRSDTVPIRFAALTVDLPAVDVCWSVDGAPSPIVTGLSYPTMTQYADVPLAQGAEVTVAPAGAGCDSEDGIVVAVERRDDDDPTHRTLVFVGDAEPGLAEMIGFEAILLSDDPEPPTTGAKVRNFHADPVAPVIDVGVQALTGQPTFLFEEVAYTQTAGGSSLGEVTARGYVDGVPLIRLPVDVFDHVTGDWILTIEGAPPFAEGKIYTLFPAGKVTTGRAEVLICEDETIPYAERPFASCELIEATDCNPAYCGDDLP